ncbi:hypothetical protein [Xylanibacter muris]|uniref:Uncharacterized protein n=1 Tax=Xylanibacter muris TaxID=2736290 RepID=A0ABX2AP21_9BACT|nr:hypothetical protein [Xylanibacter muris]NPD91777.1 hypothetical protein [Xylanibacter muris]
MRNRILFIAMTVVCCMAGKAQRTLFYESFDKCNGQGGNDLTWDESSVSVIDKDLHLDNPSWTISNVSPYYSSQGFMCMRVGEGTKNGKASSPVFKNMERNAVLYFKAGGFGQKGKGIKILVKNGYVSGTKRSSDTTVTAPGGMFSDFVVPITKAEGVSGSPYVIFDSAEPNIKNSFYLDEIRLVEYPGNQTPTRITFGENSDGTTIDNGTLRITDDVAFISPRATLCGYGMKDVRYKSGNSNVAVVDDEGTVTLRSFGTTEITAYFNGTESLAASEMSYTIDYDMSKPSTGVSFTSVKGSFKNAHGSSIMQRYTDFIGDDGNIYTFKDSATFKAIAGEDNSPLVMHISKGNLTSPLFNYRNGYTVKVTYYAKNNSVPLKIRSGNEESVWYENGPKSSAWGTGYTAVLNVTDTSQPFRITAAERGTYISRIDVIPIPVALCLDEKEDVCIPCPEYADVRLIRSLSNTYWNTFCVPFTISSDQVRSVFGDGTVISRFSGMSEDRSVMNFTPSENIEEGVAYLIMPERNVVNPEFVKVTVGTKGVNPEAGLTDGYGFRGVYSPYSLQSNELFITKRGTLSTAAQGKNIISGMRAFVVLPDIGLVRSMRLSINGNDTSLSDIYAGDITTATGDGGIYNLNGVRMAGTEDSELLRHGRANRGIYIINGKKLIIR